MNAGRPVRPPRRHRTPRPLLPVTLSWVFYLPDPTRRRPGWAGGRASPPCAPTGTPLLPGPTLRPHLLPTGTISAITSPHGPGRAGSPIWALRPPHPAGLGFVGNQASWLFMKNPEPRLGARPILPGALPSALCPPGPGTTVAGPTQDQGAWASPLSQLLGRGDGGFPSPHLWLFPHPLEYPRKNKTAELHSSKLLYPEEATSAYACWGRGARKSGWRKKRPEPRFLVWGERDCLGQVATEGPEPHRRGLGGVKRAVFQFLFEGFLSLSPPSVSPEREAHSPMPGPQRVLHKQGGLIFFDRDKYWCLSF